MPKAALPAKTPTWPTNCYHGRQHMCGRTTQEFGWRELVELVGVGTVPHGELEERFNVAPTHLCPVIRDTDERAADRLV